MMMIQQRRAGVSGFGLTKMLSLSVVVRTNEGLLSHFLWNYLSLLPTMFPCIPLDSPRAPSKLSSAPRHLISSSPTFPRKKKHVSSTHRAAFNLWKNIKSNSNVINSCTLRYFSLTSHCLSLSVAVVRFFSKVRHSPIVSSAQCWCSCCVFCSSCSAAVIPICCWWCFCWFEKKIREKIIIYFTLHASIAVASSSFL